MLQIYGGGCGGPSVCVINQECSFLLLSQWASRAKFLLASTPTIVFLIYFPVSTQTIFFRSIFSCVNTNHYFTYIFSCVNINHCFPYIFSCINTNHCFPYIFSCVNANHCFPYILSCVNTNHCFPYIFFLRQHQPLFSLYIFPVQLHIVLESLKWNSLCFGPLLRRVLKFRLSSIKSDSMLKINFNFLDVSNFLLKRKLYFTY